MIEVELPDGSIAEFPDGTPVEQIQSVLAQQFPRTSAAAVPDIPEPMGIPAPEPGPAARVARTADDVVRAIASGMTMGTADEIAAAANAAIGRGDYESNLAAERARDVSASPWARIPGEAVGMMATTALVPGAMGPGLARNVGVGAAGGGLFGFGSGEGGLQERAESAALGAGAGAAGGLLGQALSRIISPAASRDPYIQRLMKEGVTPTPGQIAGGTVGRVEQAATSIPLVSEAVQAGQRRAINEFNEAAINRALAPTGKTVKGAGNEIIDKASRYINQAWDDALKGIDVVPDTQFADDVSRIATEAAGELDDQTMGALQRQMQNISSLEGMRSPSMTGREAQKIVEKLGKDARRFMRSDNPFHRSLGETYDQIREAFVGLMQRNASPDQAAQINALRQAYPEWKIVQDAASRQGAKEGVFSPAQYMQAVRKADPTMGKAAYARGTAKGQNLGRAAREVLGNTLPNSGTTDRAIIAALLGGPAVGAIDPVAGAALGGGMLAGSLPYTPFLQRALATGMASRPAAAPAAARAAERLGLGLGFGGASAFTGS